MERPGLSLSSKTVRRLVGGFAGRLLCWTSALRHISDASDGFLFRRGLELGRIFGFLGITTQSDEADNPGRQHQSDHLSHVESPRSGSVGQEAKVHVLAIVHAGQGLEDVPVLGGGVPRRGSAVADARDVAIAEAEVHDAGVTA